MKIAETLERIAPHAWLLILGVIASLVMLVRLGVMPVQNADEGVYGEIAFEMSQSGDWLTLHYLDKDFYEKPPLKVWLSALLFPAFGASALALRLPSALAGIATSLIVALWVWEWRKARYEAFFAGLAVATMRPVFFRSFRSGDMDGLLAVWITLALYAWWKATVAGEQSHRVRWAMVIGAAIGLGILTKSVVGLIPLPIMAIHAIAAGRWRQLKWRMVVWAFAIAVAIAAPWHLAMTVLHGNRFWANYIGRHVVARSVSSLHKATEFWFYAAMLVERFTPYVWWVIPAVVYASANALRRRREERDSTLTLFLVWFAFGFVAFTLVPTRMEQYLIPLYPPAVVCIVRFIFTAGEASRSRWLALGHLAAFAAFCAWVPSSTLWQQYALFRSIQQQHALFFNPFIIAALGTTVIVIALIAVRRFFGSDAAGRAALAFTIAVTIGSGLVIMQSKLREQYAAEPIPSIATALRGTGGVLVSYGVDFKPAEHFVLRSTLAGDVRILDGRKDTGRTLELLGSNDHPRFLITQRMDPLPSELARVVSDPRHYNGFTLWRRR